MPARSLAGALALAVLAAAHAGQDWPQFRGPGGAGADAEGQPPLTWSSGSNVKWKTPLPGAGSSSPIVVGGRVFVTCYRGDGPANLSHHLLCVDRASGKVAWTADVPGAAGEDAPRGYLTEHGYASSTPASDGKAVYVFFGKVGILAFGLDGTKLWQASVGTESDEKRWGSGASPVLCDGKLIVNAARESRSIRALDCGTGKELWKAEGSRLELSFATPAVVRAPGGRTDVVVSMPGEVWGLNPNNGKLYWLARIRSEGNVVPSVVGGVGLAFLTGGFTGKGTTAVRLGGAGDVTGTHVLWSIPQSSYVPTPFLLDGRLLWVNEDGIVHAVDAKTGGLLYRQRLAGVSGGHGRPVYASPVAPGDRVYAVTRRAGVYVLEGGAEFKQLARNEPLDDSDFNATPAVSGRQLFLRSNRCLYCLEAPTKE
jgi:outer membrane protein assembly factor BamB